MLNKLRNFVRNNKKNFVKAALYASKSTKGAKGGSRKRFVGKGWKGGSSTKRRKNKKRGGNANDLHSGMAGVKTAIVLNKRVPKFDKGLWQYSQTHQAFSALTTAGKQDVQELFSIGSNAQLITNTGSSYSNFQSNTALMQLNPYLTNTGSTTQNTNVKPLTDVFLLKSANIKMEFVSLCTIAQTIDLFVVSLKKSSDISPLNIWIQGLVNEGLGKSTIVFPSTPGTATVIGAESVYEAYARPRENHLFNSYCKVEKHLVVDLAAAATETIDLNVAVNKLIKKEVIEQSIADGQFGIPKCMLYVMAIARGQLVKDTTVGSTACVYGSVEYGWSARVNYQCHSVSGNAGRLNTSLHVSSMPTGATAAAQKTIDITDVVSGLDLV